MGFFSRLFLKRRETTSDTTDEASLRPVYSPRYGGLSILYAGQSDALSIAAVYRCVQLLSDSVAGLRLRYMRMKDGRYQEDETSPLHYLLTVQPQPELSAYSFWSQAVQQMLLEGNAYIFPRYVSINGRNELTDLVLCHKGSVAHDTLNGKYVISDTYNGVWGTFKENEVIHLFLHSADGLRGESVLSHAARTMNIASAGDNETLNRFTNGGSVRGFVTNDTSVKGFGEYQDEQLEATAESIDSRFQNGERIVSLPGQSDFRQISLSSTDMQFLETRKFTVKDICRFFGVHPSFVFDDASSNYKSAEMANVAFLTGTLDPILKRIENELARKLIPRSLCCKRVFRYDRKGIYSLDLASLADYQKKTIESGIYTINDWRRMENQPVVEGGDTVYVSTNMAALGSDKLTSGVNTSSAEEPKETSSEDNEENN